MKMSLRKAAIATATVAATSGLAFGATTAFAASPTPSTTPTAASSPGKGAAKGGHATRRELRARFKTGAHGQNEFKNKDGQLVEHEWQVGTVESVSGQNVTVTDSTGTTWTWTLASGARVRVGGKAGALTGVKTGDKIGVEGVQSGSANDARWLIDPTQAAATK
jgi:hypothetical protein